VAGLADASLARLVEDPGGAPRLQMLRTIADFALERLAEAGEEEQARSRQAEHFHTLAVEQRRLLFGGDQAHAAAVLALERDNFRSVLMWCLGAAGPPPPPERTRLGMRLCATMRSYWLSYPHDMRESTPWYRRALEVGPPEDSPERAEVMLALAIDESWQGRSDHGLAATRRALEMAERIGDARVAAGASTVLAAFTLDTGDHAAVLALLDQAEQLARSADASEILSIVLMLRAESETALGHHEEAVDLYGRCLRLAMQRGDEREAVNTSVAIAAHLGMAGSPKDGLSEMERIRPSVLSLGSVVRANALEAYATLFALMGDADGAAVMTGSLWALAERLGGVVDLAEQDEMMRQPGVAAARDALGETRWRTMTDRGRQLPVEDAIEYAHARVST
jgi:tetratricopeptide (TPR) repeat protein